MTKILKDRATLIKANEGERYEINGASITFKVTSDISNNQLGIYNIELASIENFWLNPDPWYMFQG